MRDRLEELNEAEVAVILFTRARNLRGYRGRFVAPLTTLTDEGRSVYRAYGLGRQADAPDDAAESEHDTAQLGGDFVVDAEGRLTFVHREGRAGDRPTVDALVDAVRRAAGESV